MLILNLLNIVNAMEEREPEPRSNKEQNLRNLPVLPNEIRFIKWILEDYINEWNNVFNFDRDSLKA